MMFLEILGAWLLADFFSGLVHWWEDRAIAGASRFKFINGVREDNERHHTQPGALVNYNWWENINTTAPFAWVIAGLLIYQSAPRILWIATIFMGLGNLVHRWAHESKAKRPKVVTLLQQSGLLISPSHHAGHHFKRGRLVSREGSSIRFCVMSSWLNPVLDKVKFFDMLERVTIRR